MNKTDIANLALMKIGEATVKDIADHNQKASRMAALHYAPALRELLRAHFWGFALKVKPLMAVDARAYLDITGTLKSGATNVTFPRLYELLAGIDGKSAFSQDEIADMEQVLGTARWNAGEDRWELFHGGTGATWARALDMDTPDQRALRPLTPRHFLETNLAGDNGDLRYEQRSQELAPVTIEYAGTVASGTVVPVVDGRSIRVPVIAPNILETNFPGSNNDLRFEQLDMGAVAVPTIQFEADGPSARLVTILVTGSAIKVIVRGHLGWITPTANEVKEAIEAHPVARTLVRVVFKSGNDGTGYISQGEDPVDFGPTALAGGGTQVTASQVKAAIEASPFASALVTVSHKAGNNGAGIVPLMPRTSLSGGVIGVPTLRLFRPSSELAGWTYAYPLPEDFVKIRRVLDAAARGVDKFAVRRVAGKTCVLCDVADASLEYVAHVDEPDAYDPLFVAALSTLLGSKLARAITGSEQMEGQLRQVYEAVDLPAARSGQGHETQSGENHPLLELLKGTLTPGRGSFYL